MRCAIIALAALAVVACSPRTLPPAERTDSVRVEIRERVVHDTALVQIEREVEKVVTRDTVSRLENTYARSEARVEAGLLHHSLETTPRTIRIPVTTTVHDTTYIEKEAVKEYVEVNRLTEGQAFWMRLGKVLLGIDIVLLLIAIALAVLKFYLKR